MQRIANESKLYPKLLFSFLLIYLVYTQSTIHFMNGELGRLLTEGKLFFSDFEIIQTNHFSYPNYNYPIENYHWLSALIMYLVHEILGFKGLHLIGVFLLLWAFYHFYKYWFSECNPIWVAIASILCTPLMMNFPPMSIFIFPLALAVFFLLFTLKFIQEKLPPQHLWFLVFGQLLWVNMHASYYWGWLILVATCIQIYFSNNTKEEKSVRSKQITKVTLAALLISILNPQWWAVWLTPFSHVWISYASLPLDVQDVFTRINHFEETLDTTPIYIIVVSLAAIIALFFCYKEKNISSTIVYYSILIFSGITISFVSIQQAPFLAIIALTLFIPLGHYYLNKYDAQYFWSSYQSPFVVLVYLLFPVVFWIESAPWLSSTPPTFGWGVHKNALDAVTFIKQTGINGPFFNNRAASGALIYSLYPEQHSFIDDRYNSQSNSFLETEYFPNINEDDLTNWHQLKNKYAINAIYFNIEEESPKKMLFLGNRLSDGEWALVYQNKDKDVLLLRQNKENQSIIQKYQRNTPNN